MTVLRLLRDEYTQTDTHIFSTLKTSINHFLPFVQDSGMEGGAAVSQGDDQRWLRPATDREEYFEIAHQNCLCLTFYSLALSATKPLKEDLVRRALVHLYRHVLRCLIRAFCVLLDVFH